MKKLTKEIIEKIVNERKDCWLFYDVETDSKMSKINIREYGDSTRKNYDLENAEYNDSADLAYLSFNQYCETQSRLEFFEYNETDEIWERDYDAEGGNSCEDIYSNEKLIETITNNYEYFKY